METATGRLRSRPMRQGLQGLARRFFGVSVRIALLAPAGAAAQPDADPASAARLGEMGALAALLAAGADPNAAHADGMSALHWAAFHGNEEMVELLLDRGADPNAVTRLGAHAPLHVASREGRPEAVKALLLGGADHGLRTHTGAAALHFAALAGDAESIRALAAAGADVDAAESQWGHTALMLAAAEGREEAARALLAAGADPLRAGRVIDLVERDVLDRASEAARRRRIAAIRRGEEPEAVEEASEAAVSQAEAAAREALEAQRRTGEPIPLNYAALVGVYGGLSAIHLAAREGRARLVRLLLDHGVDIDHRTRADGTTPLLMAAINGHFDLATELLARGADPDAESGAGATPLYAVLNVQWWPKARHPQPLEYQQQRVTYLELMRRLLEAGARVDPRLKRNLWYTTYNRDLLGVDRTGATPFWRAAHATDLQAMKLLLEFGADPGLPTTTVPKRSFGARDATDHSGLPEVPLGGPAVYPIHAAAGVGYGQGFAGNSHRHAPEGWLPTVRFLVEELGADVNARDFEGYTPAHHAAARGDNELIRYLASKGADITLVARSGQTTVDMANGPVQRIQPFPETIALLEKLGARNSHRCVSC